MILEHQGKVERELQSPNPQESLIAYWRKRIREVEAKISRLEVLLQRH